MSREIYHYQGREGEEIPRTVTELIVTSPVQILPKLSCISHRSVRQVRLNSGLQRIDDDCFHSCKLLNEITIRSTVQIIGRGAFQHCPELKKLEFEDTESSPSQLQTVGDDTFSDCSMLPTFKLPSSVNSIGRCSFAECSDLVIANLSAARLPEIPEGAFIECSSLQTVGMPNTLGRIGGQAFYFCTSLVTVVVPFDSQPIRIGSKSFYCCPRLANLELPEGSFAEDSSFDRCKQLRKFYGNDHTNIVAGLIRRFDNLDVHKMVYYNPTNTATDLQACIKGKAKLALPVDGFGMTPLHVLLSTIDPRIELLQVFLNHYSYQQLLCARDVNGNTAFDYLFQNWTPAIVSLLERTLWHYVLAPLAHWGPFLWLELMETKVEAFRQEIWPTKRKALFHELFSDFEKYENTERTSVLELALWKAKLQSERNHEGVRTRRLAQDREACRFVCGSDVVIPNVVAFLWG